MIVMAFDQHREQITFDALDTETGVVSRGRIRPADRLGFRAWLGYPTFADAYKIAALDAMNKFNALEVAA